MKFYHCTRSKYARKILRLKKPNKINLSEFFLEDCMNFWIRHLVTNSNSNILPRHYYSFGEEIETFWLGKGFYCFSEKNKEESIFYARKLGLDVIISVNYSEEYTEFRMDENKNILISFLDNDVKKEFQSKYSGEMLEAFELLIEYLKLEIEDEYYENPQAAGLIMELYLCINSIEFDVVSNKFLKSITLDKYDNYSAIRNKNLIEGYEYNEELSHKIRV